MNYGYAFIEFYVSLVTYTVMHMIFVISSDFVEAFSIPPLNIGIYVDKLAAIRALLMVIADIIEWQATKDDHDMMKALTDVISEIGSGKGARRVASLLSFLAMLICRITYLRLLYKSDNKSLHVFITLCIEGFWFGTFQMSFFAIGPEYNAFTSLGIHTMGNFIFFLQLILQHRAKSKPYINCLYRVRVHGWTCLVTSLIALGAWIYFCYDVTASGEDAPSEWPNQYDVWSPFLLFIVGAFAEDFSVPGVLPFAFLDPEKANLINYLTPVFFMTGAIATVFVNDGTKAIGLETNASFKDWSASTNAKDKGMPWHSLWALNIPKYIAFFISMFSIHGRYDNLRCIIQSRWRVLVLTMTVVVPRAWLETAGYVGVANYAIGRSDLFLGGLAGGLKKGEGSGGVTSNNYKKNGIEKAIGTSAGTRQIQFAIADLVQQVLGLSVKEPGFGNAKHITAEHNPSANTNENKVKVIIKDETSTKPKTVEGATDTVLTTKNQVTITITLKGTHSDLGNKTTEANRIAKRIWEAAVKAVKQAEADISAERDFKAFQYIAFHDILAMFCRFVYGKFAVGYKSTTIKFRIGYI